MIIEYEFQIQHAENRSGPTGLISTPLIIVGQNEQRCTFRLAPCNDYIFYKSRKSTLCLQCMKRVQ